MDHYNCPDCGEQVAFDEETCTDITGCACNWSVVDRVRLTQALELVADKFGTVKDRRDKAQLNGFGE